MDNLLGKFREHGDTPPQVRVAFVFQHQPVPPFLLLLLGTLISAADVHHNGLGMIFGIVGFASSVTFLRLMVLSTALATISKAQLRDMQLQQLLLLNPLVQVGHLDGSATLYYRGGWVLFILAVQLFYRVA